MEHTGYYSHYYLLCTCPCDTNILCDSAKMFTILYNVFVPPVLHLNRSFLQINQNLGLVLILRRNHLFQKTDLQHTLLHKLLLSGSLQLQQRILGPSVYWVKVVLDVSTKVTWKAQGR